MRILFLAICLILTAFLMIGCSESNIVPVGTDISDHSQPIASDIGQHQFLGEYILDFDADSLTAEVHPSRNLSAHFNVTNKIHYPQLSNIDWDPVSSILNLDVTLENPFPFTVYDVRLIIMSTDSHVLLEPDSWTGLFDPPGGDLYNGFKMVNTGDQSEFSGHSQATVNVSILIPMGNFSVPFAIDASAPGHCVEPYHVSELTYGEIYEYAGSSTTGYLTVLDHQNDADNVSFICPDVCGAVQFDYDTDNVWTAEISNVLGAPKGSYVALVVARQGHSGELAIFRYTVLEVISEP